MIEESMEKQNSQQWQRQGIAKKNNKKNQELKAKDTGRHREVELLAVVEAKTCKKSKTKNNNWKLKIQEGIEKQNSQQWSKQRLVKNKQTNKKQLKAKDTGRHRKVELIAMVEAKT